MGIVKNWKIVNWEMGMDISKDPIYTEAKFFCDPAIIPPVLKQLSECCAPIAFVDNISTSCNVLLKNKLKSKRRLVLSPQSMIDCGKWSFSGADSGATEDECAEYAKNKGVYEESVYPFTGRQDKCKKPKGIKVRISGLKRVTGDILKNIEKRPLVTGVKVCDGIQFHTGNRAWDVYTNPIRIPTLYSEDDGYHAVLVVGYGEKDGVAYFIIKNSYGIDWGVQGFGRIACDLFEEQFYYPRGPFKFTNSNPSVGIDGLF